MKAMVARDAPALPRRRRRCLPGLGTCRRQARRGSEDSLHGRGTNDGWARYVEVSPVPDLVSEAIGKYASPHLGAFTYRFNRRFNIADLVNRGRGLPTNNFHESKPPVKTVIF